MILAKIDKNFNIKSNVGESDVVWFSVREEPFELYGLHDPQNTERFCRMPDDIAKSVSEGVAGLNYHTAGGRVRFSTDSPYIAVKAIKSFNHSPHMTHAMQNGFDLFSVKNGFSTFVAAFIPPVDSVDGFEQLKNVGGGKMTSYTLNFPLYSGAKEVYIGIKAGSHLGAGEKYRDIKPVVYYGSSITQGGCATRPGNCYPAIISQRYNLDYINLGFAGNCRAEIPMAEYLREMDMSIFVCDYDHNAPNPEYLKNTHRRLYDIFREKQPDTPYVMITKPDIWRTNVREEDIRRDIVFATFSDALAMGDRNVYFIDGKTLFGSDIRDNCTVDGCHPNDLGFYRMAENIGIVIKEIVEEL